MTRATYRYKAYDVDELTDQSVSLALGEFDLLLTVASWEDRCTCITEIGDLSALLVKIIRFKPPGEDNGRAENAAILREHFTRISAEIGEISLGYSTDTNSNTPLFLQDIVDLCKEFARPIRICIDTSCMPKYYCILLIAFLIRAKLASNIVCYYAHALYDENYDKNVHLVRYTEGDWSAVQVPFLEGDYDLSRGNTVVASVGGEPSMVHKFLTRYQAENIRLIVPLPGVSKTMDKLAKASADDICKVLELYDDRVKNCKATSSIEFINLIQAEIAAGRLPPDSTLLPLGPKPHGLAIGVVAALVPTLSVTCRIPQRYSEKNLQGSGAATILDVTDRLMGF